jgi:hypothetical protein
LQGAFARKEPARGVAVAQLREVLEDQDWRAVGAEIADITLQWFEGAECHRFVEEQHDLVFGTALALGAGKRVDDRINGVTRQLSPLSR